MLETGGCDSSLIWIHVGHRSVFFFLARRGCRDSCGLPCAFDAATEKSKMVQREDDLRGLVFQHIPLLPCSRLCKLFLLCGFDPNKGCCDRRKIVRSASRRRAMSHPLEAWDTFSNSRPTLEVMKYPLVQRLKGRILLECLVFQMVPVFKVGCIQWIFDLWHPWCCDLLVS